MSRMYRNKQEYIDSLKTVMSAREDFKDLAYHKHPSSQEEYLFMTDIIGRVYMFDITAMKNEQIFHTMAQLECGHKPTNFIEDTEKMLELGKLFNN